MKRIWNADDMARICFIKLPKHIRVIYVCNANTLNPPMGRCNIAAHQCMSFIWWFYTQKEFDLYHPNKTLFSNFFLFFFLFPELILFNRSKLCLSNHALIWLALCCSRLIPNGSSCLASIHHNQAHGFMLFQLWCCFWPKSLYSLWLFALIENWILLLVFFIIFAPTYGLSNFLCGEANAVSHHCLS